jgi:hypothetical protein
MRKNFVLRRAAGALSSPEGSTVWDLDIWKSESGFECWVADARGGDTLARTPLKSRTVSSIVEALEMAIRDLGLPSVIRTDCGTEFTGQGFRRFLASHGIGHQVMLPGPTDGGRPPRPGRMPTVLS